MLKLPAKTETDPFHYFPFQLIWAFATTLWSFCLQNQVRISAAVDQVQLILQRGNILLLLSRCADVPRHDRPENDGKNKQKKEFWDSGRFPQLRCSRRSCSLGSWLWWRPSSRPVSGRWGPAGRRTPTTHRWHCSDSRIPEYQPVRVRVRSGSRSGTALFTHSLTRIVF